MNPQHTSRECASVDHRYWDFVVMWCPHRQQFSLSRATYLETGSSESDPDYRYERVDFGPFDQLPAVRDELVAWIDDSLAGIDGSSPRLPGS